MEFKKILETAENSSEYVEFKKHHPESYLVHIFTMSQSPSQIGYYSKETKNITTFELGSEIKVTEQAPFQEIKHEIKQLELEKVKLDIDDVLRKANEVKKEHYPQELVDKEIVILQNLEKEGQIFNITFITATFKTLNIKINADNGNIISHNLDNLVGL